MPEEVSVTSTNVLCGIRRRYIRTE